jgi:methylmalonyl-CoA/ethylmalonyl-CoA epimerase
MPEVRFDHIAIAVPRLAEASAVLMGVLGGLPHHGGPSGAYRFGQWRFAGGGRLEVLEPLGENGFLHRFLAQRGPGIHHVTFRVPSLVEACDRARSRGYEIVGYDDSDPRWSEAFLHPRQALGIVVQLAESRITGSGSRPPRWEPPPSPPSHPEPVTILGLRLRARSRERASIQWGEILQGERVEGPGEALVYQWPRSPLRLAVEIDPGSPEGPIAIEYASERAIGPPGGPHPVLGATFVRRPERRPA